MVLSNTSGIVRPPVAQEPLSSGVVADSKASEDGALEAFREGSRVRVRNHRSVLVLEFAEQLRSPYLHADGARRETGEQQRLQRAVEICFRPIDGGQRVVIAVLMHRATLRGVEGLRDIASVQVTGAVLDVEDGVISEWVRGRPAHDARQAPREDGLLLARVSVQGELVPASAATVKHDQQPV